MRKAILQIKTECHLYSAWDNSVKGAGHLEAHHQLLAFCKSQLLKKPPAVCEFGGARFPRWSQWNHLANKNSDLTMCGKGLIQKRWCLATSYTEEGPNRENGSCLTSSHPKATQLIFSLYVSGTFQASVPPMELRMSAWG